MATSMPRSNRRRGSSKPNTNGRSSRMLSMGPACSFVEIKDGIVTCWSGTQKSHFVAAWTGRTIAVPVDKVHVIWQAGPGSYGRNDADDCAMDAAMLAKAVGRPVRLQYMRDQGTGWDPKGPASTHIARRP